MKNSFSLSYVVNMMQHIVQAMESGKDRLQYFNSVMDMFKELILDLHEFADPGKLKCLSTSLLISVHLHKMFKVITKT